MSVAASRETAPKLGRTGVQRASTPALQDMTPHNILLSALSARELRLFRDIARPVSLLRGADLFRLGATMSETYFIEEGLASIRTSLDDGREIETYTVGSEGVLGLMEAQGGGSATANAHVTVAGVAWRAPAKAFRALKLDNPAFDAAMARHVEAVIDELQVGLACHAIHGIHQRLGRWLLERRDRLGGNPEVVATQACLAIGLGVQRTSISEAMQRLYARKLVISGRGIVTILDSEGLKQASCSCRAALSQRREARVAQKSFPFLAD